MEKNIELLNAKLAIPPLRGPVVSRRRLLKRLEEGLNHRISLLSAPAGSGKTTLVTEWLAICRGPAPAAAWVSLDAGDNDPLRFWRYVFSAIQAFDKEASQSALACLHASHQPHYESALTAFINRMVERPGRVILILEDYHTITNVEIHEAMTFLLDHLPPALHLVLITRHDPPLPLARLRARNEVSELRAQDLRFSEAETRLFLQLALPPETHQPQLLSQEIASHLAARTEGWAAGLRLAALALQGRGESSPAGQAQFLEKSFDTFIETFIETFTGGHRPVVEYLAAEVLASQKEEVQVFLLETSFLTRLSASLCDAVTGRSDSALRLALLLQANLFLEPLDGAGEWFRFHALFSEAMQSAARQRLGEARLHALACNASRWYEAHGLLAEAVEAALFAQAPERAAGLIERSVGPHLVGNEYHTLLRWIRSLPEACLYAHPRLCMAYAQALLFTSPTGAPAEPGRLQRLLEMAEQAWAAGGNEPRVGEVLALHALAAVRQGDYPRAFPLARQALARLPEDDPAQSSIEWRGICLIFTGWEEYLAGRLLAAFRSFTAARHLLQAAGNLYGVLDSTLGLGEIQAGRGELQQAEAFFRQALAEIESAPIERKDQLKRQGRALLGLAEVAYERNDLAAAEQSIAQAAAISQEPGREELQGRVLLMQLRLKWSRKEIEPARRLLDAQLPRIKHPALLREIQAWQAWLALAAGDQAVVEGWLAGQGSAGQRAGSISSGPDGSSAGSLPVFAREREALSLARVQTARGEAGAALRQLEPWLAEARVENRLRSELEILVLQALAEAALNRLPPARRTLARALALGQASGCLRVFLDEGEPIRWMILDCRSEIEKTGQENLLDFIDHLLEAFSMESAGEEPRINSRFQLTAGSLPDPLSQQEARVLGLLAAGLSNPEIADELVVSVNTVKTHVKSVYRKLHVNSRRAVRSAARGQARGSMHSPRFSS